MPRRTQVYKSARGRVHAKYGTQARGLLGDTLYRAVLAEAIFFTMSAQDEHIDGDTLKRIMRECHTNLIDEMNT